MSTDKDVNGLAAYRRTEVQRMIRDMEDVSSRLYDLAQEGEKWGYQDKHNNAHVMAGKIEAVAEFIRALDWRG